MPLIKIDINPSGFWDKKPYPNKITMRTIKAYLERMLQETPTEQKAFIESGVKKLSWSGLERLSRHYEENYGTPTRKTDMDILGVSTICEAYSIGFIECSKP